MVSMMPSRPAFPLVTAFERIRERAATYRHWWFKVLVWFLFGAMTMAFFPGFVAVWFWRLSHQPPPGRGRRVSMLLLAALAGLFQLLWTNLLIIDPLAGLGEARDQPLGRTTADAGSSPAGSATSIEAEPASTANAPQVEVEIEDATAAALTTTSLASVPDTINAEAEGDPTTGAQLETTTSTAPPAPAPATTAASDATAPVPQTTAAPVTTTTASVPPATPAGRALATLAVAEEGDGGVAYDRDLYGSWTRVRSGCNTRCAVLEKEKRADGTWLSWYDGVVTSDASRLDIDHMVPLAEAHSSGAWQWNSSRRTAYANDLLHPQALAAVSASSNRSKGSRDPSEWRPSDASAWCRYATDWVTVKAAWGLTADRAEVGALREMLGTCDSSVTITTLPARQTTTTTVTVATSTTAVPTADASCPYTSAAGDPCSEVPELANRSNDVNCGDIPSRFKPLTVVGRDHDRLDGNNDGQACTS
ncbi:MAG: HNH endonuclease family protein [bacterium]|nr:HNH endonuclease family protein [bacterium]